MAVETGSVEEEYGRVGRGNMPRFGTPAEQEWVPRDCGGKELALMSSY